MYISPSTKTTRQRRGRGRWRDTIQTSEDRPTNHPHPPQSPGWTDWTNRGYYKQCGVQGEAPVRKIDFENGCKINNYSARSASQSQYTDWIWKWQEFTDNSSKHVGDLYKFCSPGATFLWYLRINGPIEVTRETIDCKVVYRYDLG